MRSTCSSWRRPTISSRSRHSRRTLPTQRSMWAFAFGACTGVRMTLIFSVANSASNRARKLRVSIVDQEPHPPVALGECYQQVARLLQHPSGVGPAGAGEVLDSSAADRKEHEHVQAAQPNRVDREEIAGEDRLALDSQEAAP